VAFAKEWLGLSFVWQKQRDLMESVRDNRLTAAVACNASSKTFTAAIIAIWWMTCFQPAKVVTTAPSRRQVEELLWAEIGRLHGASKYPLPGEPGTSSWRMPGPKDAPKRNADWFATGFSTRPDQVQDQAAKFQGYHSPNLLLIFDEASGILAAIHKAAWGILTSENTRWLQISNPTDPSSVFAEYYRSRAWHSIHIDGHDSPNFTAGKVVAPFLITPVFAQNLADTYGKDSPEYRMKVRGLFPEGADDTVLGLGEVMEAFHRVAVAEPDELVGIGCDVARFGSDRTTIYVTKGPHLLHAEGFHNKRAGWIAGRLIQLARHYGLTRLTAHRIAVDVTGDAGVADMLHSQGWQANEVNFGSKATDEKLYFNRRSELWFEMARWIRYEAGLAGAPRIAKDMLKGDLPAPHYKYRPNGQKQLEPKDVLKKRIGRSPDDGDALVLALAHRTTVVAGYALDEEPPDRREREEVQRVLTAPDIDMDADDFVDFLERKQGGIF